MNPYFYVDHMYIDTVMPQRLAGRAGYKKSGTMDRLCRLQESNWRSIVNFIIHTIKD